MTKLNLAAKGDDQIAVLNYLQQNATDVLADKIKQRRTDCERRRNANKQENS